MTKCDLESSRSSVNLSRCLQQFCTVSKAYAYMFTHTAIVDIIKSLMTVGHNYKEIVTAVVRTPIH
jgi:hypothetical protein